MVFETILSGIGVFILGQLFLEIILKPKLKYREVVGKIDNKLKFYAHVITNPGIPKTELITNCSHELRELSCDLESVYKQILLKQRGRDKNISEAASLLINLSNSLYEAGHGIRNSENLDRVRKLLYIPQL